MKNRAIILATLILSMTSCSKVFVKDESLPLGSAETKTILRNHTFGADYTIGPGGLSIIAECIIEPGVEIRIAAGAFIQVSGDGFISAIGNEDEKIRLICSNPEANWGGIQFHGTAPSILEHVEIDHAGAAGWDRAAVEVFEHADLEIANTHISGSGNASALMLQRNTNLIIGPGAVFTENRVPIQMELHAQIQWVGENTLSGNTEDVIRVRNFDGSPLLTESDLAMNKQPLPYSMSAGLVISEHILTLLPGTQLLFVDNAGITGTGNPADHNARLLIQGTEALPVIINESLPGQGWKGIYMSNGSADIQHADVMNVLQSDSTRGSITIGGQASAQVRSNHIINSSSSCSIVLLGAQAVLNPDVAQCNIFINSSGYCQK